MRTSPPQQLPIFRSFNQAHILSAVSNARRLMTLADISELTKVPYATVHREVRRLIDAGIFNENKIGSAVVVEFNPDSPMTLPLRQLIETVLGPVPILKDLLSKIDGIAAVYIFGSWAARASGISGPPPADIDVIIIGNPEVGEIYKACRSAGLRLHQTVNPILMGESEWREPSAFNESIKSRPLVTVLAPETEHILPLGNL